MQKHFSEKFSKKRIKIFPKVLPLVLVLSIVILLCMEAAAAPEDGLNLPYAEHEADSKIADRAEENVESANALPDDYVPGEDAQGLETRAELGGRREVYLNKDEPPKEGDKYVNAWSYVSRGGSSVSEFRPEDLNDTYRYFMDYYLVMSGDKEALKQKLSSVLPIQISGTGNNSGNALVDAGFILAPGEGGTGTVKGFVNINWTNFESEIDSTDIRDGIRVTFYAEPVYNIESGKRIRVNTNNTELEETGSNKDTLQRSDILNLTITLHDLHLDEHVVPSVNPADTTVNLFDYWVDTDGAAGNDILDKNDQHTNAAGNTPFQTGVGDWNKGINVNRLLLFGDGNLHAGYWNKGAGAGSDYGMKKAGMMGIVRKVLEDGYPIIDTDEMKRQMSGFEGVSDNKLCGDHMDGLAYDSTNPQNISDTVIDAWIASGNTASLDYLFDPDIENRNKRSYKDVKGLFQLDAEGYYYYNMRQNFAEYDEARNEFILYDAPATDRTDKKRDENGNLSDERSIGNFLPFNTGEQVFDLVEGGKLGSNPNITSSNKEDADQFMNHHLGMTLSVDFRQPLNGRVNTGTTNNVPMTFQFSGDDDVWIFIDDVLVLDLGGIHSEIYGTIDFATGEIKVGQSWKTNGFPYKADGTVDLERLYQEAAPVQSTTIREQFKAAGMEGAALWNGDTNTFASNTGHTLKMFYLERGNYDSSLAVRFNLQSALYQKISKVDQDGRPLGGVEFDLYPACETVAGDPAAIECLYTDNQIHDNKEFYVKREDGAAWLVHLVTGEDGTAQFRVDGENYFNFADRGAQYYILRETKTPDGYKTLPMDIVLYYDPATSMLSVANRWSTGAYACSMLHVNGTGRLNYGRFNSANGNIEANEGLLVSAKRQEEGLVVAIPMLLRDSDHVWEALYGSNLQGFTASRIAASDDVAAWRNAALRAVLEQVSKEEYPSWSLSWDEGSGRLTGTLEDLPGLASRYRQNNPDGDMRIVYGIIEGDALRQLGIQEGDANARREELGRYVREHGIDGTLAAIMGVDVSDTGSGQGFSFLNSEQFNKDFRSLIYIPNDQRELWVMKVDQDGNPRDGAVFGLYADSACTGNPVARGTTATVNGQEGTLIFSPANETGAGHARMMWASSTRTHYYLKEISAPDGCLLNDTITPVVVGTYSVYADAGTPENGVSVMAGVGRLTQVMRQYAIDGDVDVTLQDITAIQQTQPSKNTNVLAEDWEDVALENASGTLRSINLHYGRNAVVDYGLHDEDGGKYYKPFFVTDEGFIRTRVRQNYLALTTPMYGDVKLDVNKDDLGDTDITNLFSLLNVVVVTDQTSQDTDTGRLAIGKMLAGENLTGADYTKNFQFKIRLTNENGQALTGRYYFYGTDKAGYLADGDVLPLHHDESITVLGLPAGTRYEVTEETAAGWYVFPKTGTVSGEIAKDTTQFASFRNGKQEWPDVGSLVIHKTVTGDGDRTREFTFVATFTDEDGKELEEAFAYDGDKEGTIKSGESVTLGHDQHVTIYGIPAGTRYAVSEQEANQDGYVTSSVGEAGVIEDGMEYTAAFMNDKKKEEPPVDPDPEPNPPVNPNPEPNQPVNPNPEPNPPVEPNQPINPNPTPNPVPVPTPETPNGTSDSSGTVSGPPQTGDAQGFVGFLQMMSLSGLGVALVARKKANEKKKKND